MADSSNVLLQVLAPYDAEDARGLLKAAVRDPDPVVFLENEILYGESFPVNDKVLDKDFTVPIGKVKVSLILSSPVNRLQVCLHAAVSCWTQAWTGYIYWLLTFAKLRVCFLHAPL